MLLQAAEAALQALKGQTDALVSNAAVLADKLAAERRYSSDLERQLKDASTAVTTQQMRASQAITLMRKAQLHQEASRKELQDAHAEAQRAWAAVERAEVGLTEAQAQCSRQAERAERLAVQLAASQARAAELQVAANSAQTRLQVWHDAYNMQDTFASTFALPK